MGLAPDFMYLISSVNSQVPSSQYVKLQVPLPMTGINVAALGLDFWNDTGGAGGGISTLSPIPAVGMELDDASKVFAEKYRAKYGDDRPIFPHFNGFNAYHGVRNAFAAAERAGGFEPLDDWVREMENTDVKLYKDGEFWHRYAYFKPGEIEPRTEREYVHNIKFDLTPPYDDGAPSMVVIHRDHDPHHRAERQFRDPSRPGRPRARNRGDPAERDRRGTGEQPPRPGGVLRTLRATGGPSPAGVMRARGGGRRAGAGSRAGRRSIGRSPSMPWPPVR